MDFLLLDLPVSSSNTPRPPASPHPSYGGDPQPSLEAMLPPTPLWGAPMSVKGHVTTDRNPGV